MTVATCFLFRESSIPSSAFLRYTNRHNECVTQGISILSGFIGRAGSCLWRSNGLREGMTEIIRPRSISQAWASLTCKTSFTKGLSDVATVVTVATCSLLGRRWYRRRWRATGTFHRRKREAIEREEAFHFSHNDKPRTGHRTEPRDIVIPRLGPPSISEASVVCAHA